jgi:tetratricopeptide (TPR) repeat protein
LLTTDTKTAQPLYEQAIEKYQKNLIQKPNSQEAQSGLIAAFLGWGHKLVAVALKEVKQGKHCDALAERVAIEQLLAGAVEKWQEILALDPNNLYALYHWGVTLHLQARVANGEEQEHLFSEAEQKYLQVENLKIGHSAYGLAGLAVLRGEVDNARQWLERGIKYKTLPLRHQIEDDPDFKGYHACQWFQDILKQAPQNEDLKAV